MRRTFITGRLFAALLCFSTLPVLAAPAPSTAPAAPGYFRFPAVHDQTLVFTAEGDLWTAPLGGGQARRLTTHAGQETQAAISPDGRQVAFVAEYDGDGDVFAMPLAGGAPTRLSFDGGRVQVHGWSPQGEVIFSSEDLVGPTARRVVRLADPTTLATRELPLHDANHAAFDARGRVLVGRFGVHVRGDNARNYRGGAMGQLWLFDPSTNAEAQRLGSDADGAMHSPMRIGERWYFIGNRDGIDALWSMAAEGSDFRKHVQHDGWDIRAARSDGARIVYQLGADVRVFDPSTGDDRSVPLTLLSDFEQRRERWLENPVRFIEDVRLSPKGDRVAVTVRGRVAVAGPGPKRRVEVASPAEHRARGAVPSHDGRVVYAISNTDGRPEIWRYAADGRSEAKQLTRGGAFHRWALYPSPDGRHIAHTDKSGALNLLSLDSGRDVRIDRSAWTSDDPYGSIAWSRDGKALAFARPDSRGDREQIFIHRIGDARPTAVTSPRYVSYAPSFSPDGQWLYFLSERSFTAWPPGPWGDRNTGPGFDRRAKVYALALQPGNRFPFAPANELMGDDEADGSDDNEGDEKGEAKNDGKAKSLPPIAMDGLADRLYETTVEPGNYANVFVAEERLYLHAFERDEGSLLVVPINDKGDEPKVFVENVFAAEITPDRKRIAYAQQKGEDDAVVAIVDTTAELPGDLSDSLVRLGDWRLPIDPVREWRQMFADAWTMHRDFSFDPAMRGLDWNAVRAQHEPLLSRVTDRAELDDLLAQMIAPLSILHSQVRGADVPEDVESATAAMLGAEFATDASGVRIARIYRSDRELPSERSPLAQPGVDARDGDLLVSVNGRAVRNAGELAAALHHQAGQQVLLGLRRGPRDLRTVVVPVDARRNATLRYGDWVQGRIAAVEKAGEGRIGYLHLRAMGGGDMAGFVRDFYANVYRDGLIIDVRRNNGGNIDSWVLATLLRRDWAFWQAPGRTPHWNMQQTFRGHLVVLADALTYSDGETFAAGVKALGLGPVVGTRTAGAGIWLSDRNGLSDGGIARIAEFGQFGADGRWLIEGRGVSPDVEVDNLPHESYLGRDRQLDTAIEMLQQKLRENPVVQPPAQVIPPPSETGRDVKP